MSWFPQPIQAHHNGCGTLQACGLCCTPPAKLFLQPPGWVSPQMGTGTLVLVATEHRQVVNAPRAPPRDHLVAG